MSIHLRWQVLMEKGLLTKSFNYALENHYIMTLPANRLVIPQNMQPDKPTRRKEHIYLAKDNIDSLFEIMEQVYCYRNLPAKD